SLAFAVLVLLSSLLSAAQAQPAFMVKDIGDTVSPLSPLGGLAGVSVEVDGVLYFAANDGVHGTELWRSDGTTAGTWLIRDVCPGNCSSFPFALIPFRHKVYWLSSGQLWASDGTAQ